MKIFRNIILLSLLAIGLVLLLYLYSEKPNQNSNGFNRVFSGRSFFIKAEMKRGEVLKNIAGYDGEFFYFGTKRPDEIHVVDSDFKFLRNIRLPLKPTEKLESNFTSKLSGNHIFLFASNVPAIMVFDKVGDSLRYTLRPKGAFSRAVSTRDSGIILKGFYPPSKEQLLQKINPDTLFLAPVNPFPVLNDGGFATDGLINYDPDNRIVVYTHFYSNRLIALNSDLKILYNRRLIDTFSRYSTFGRAFKSSASGVYNLAKPPVYSQTFSIIDKGKLLVVSGLKADNESVKEFKENTTVDVYSTLNGRYIHSFYLPNRAGSRVREIFSTGDLLLALYKDEVVLYKMK